MLFVFLGISRDSKSCLNNQNISKWHTVNIGYKNTPWDQREGVLIGESSYSQSIGYKNTLNTSVLIAECPLLEHLCSFKAKLIKVKLVRRILTMFLRVPDAFLLLLDFFHLIDTKVSVFFNEWKTPRIGWKTRPK